MIYWYLQNLQFNNLSYSFTDNYINVMIFFMNHYIKLICKPLLRLKKNGLQNQLIWDRDHSSFSYW